MDEKQLQLLWDLHGKNGGFSSFDEFRGLMNDPNSRRVFFDDTNKDLGFKDYNDFESTLGVKKKRGSIDIGASSLEAGNALSDGGLDGTTPTTNDIPTIEMFETDGDVIPTEDIVGLANKSKELSGRKKTLSTGSSSVGITTSTEVQDDEAKAESEKINKYLEEKGYDPKRVANDFEGIDEDVFNIPSLSKPELLRKYKENPQQYARNIATAKSQSELRRAALSLPNGEEVWRSIKNDYNVSDVGDFTQQRGVVKNIVQKAKDVTDGNEDVVRNLAIDFSDKYGEMAMHPNSIQDAPSSLNSYQQAGWTYLNDFFPDQARRFKAALLNPKDIEGNYDAELQRQESLKALTQTGLDLSTNYAKERLNDLGKDFEYLSKKAEAGTITPQESETLLKIQEQAAPLQERLDAATTERSKFKEQFPRSEILGARTFAQELLGQEHTGLDWFLLESGRATGNTVNGVVDFVKQPFLSDLENEINQAEILGSGKRDDYETNLTQKNKIDQSFKPELSPELQSEVDAIKKDKALSYDEKLTKVSNLLLDRTNEWQRTPDSKSNVGLSSLMYGVGGLAANLAPFIVAEMGTGGGATAGFARKFASTFTAAAATSFHEAYRESLEKGDPNPFARAMRVTAINSAAMAGAQTPAAIRKMLGNKTAYGKMVERLTDAEIMATLKESPKALKTFANSVKQVTGNAVKEGAKFSTLMSAAQATNDAMDGDLKPLSEYAKHAAIETLKFGILGSAMGGIGKITRPTDIQLANVIDAAKNKESYLSMLDRMVGRGEINLKDAAEVKKNIEDVAAIYEKSPILKNENISGAAQREYLFNGLTKKRALENAKELPEKQKAEAEKVALVADFKNQIILDQNSIEDLNKKQAKIEKDLTPEKDADGKNIPIKEAEKIKLEAELEAVKQSIKEKENEVTVTKPTESEAPTTIGGESEPAPGKILNVSKPFDESKISHVVYRADSGRKGTDSGVTFFTSNETYAKSYGEDMKGNKTGDVKPYYVDLKNPLVVSINKERAALASGELVERAKREGHDGIIAKDELGTGNGIDEIVVFDKKQFKEIGKSESGQGNAEPPTSVPVEGNGIYAEPKKTIFSHRGLQEVATEFGLDDVTSRERKSDAKLLKDVENKIDKWTKDGVYEQEIAALVKRAEGKDGLNDEDNLMMAQHIANLRLKGSESTKGSKEYIDILNEMQKVVKAGQAARSEQGAALRVPTGSTLGRYDLPSMLVEKANSLETTVDKLSKDQIEKIEKQQAEIEAKTKDAETKLADAQAEIAKLKAEIELKSEKGKRQYVRKKNREALSKEREDIFASISEKLKKARGETSAVAVPYAKELIAIAPDVMKLFRNYVETGTSKLADVVDNIHEVLKKSIPQITKKDVTDIIAGEYREKKTPLSDLQIKLKELRAEAKAISGEAEALRKKEIADRKRAEREAAKEGKKKDNKSEQKSEEEKKLDAAKDRAEKQIKDIEEKIKSKDFEPQKRGASISDDQLLKQANPKKWKETMDAIIAKDEAMADFELAKRKDELSKKKWWQKAFNFGKLLVSTSKAIKAGIDDSITFVQMGLAVMRNPTKAASAKVAALKDISAKNFKRNLAALHNSPLWPAIKIGKLDITEPKSLTKENLEETFSGNLLDKDFKLGNGRYNLWKNTGGIFERIFTSFGNNLRVKLYEAKVNELISEGKTVYSHPEEYQAVARVINEMTGRGKVDPVINKSMERISPIIWAPKMLSSSFNILGLGDLAHMGKHKGFYRSLTPAARKYALSQIGGGIGVGVSVMTALAMAGWDADADPRSSSFGSVTTPDGNTKYNVFGRYAGVVKMVVQAIGGTRVSAEGETQDIDKSIGGRFKTLATFARGKMTPAAGFVTDYWLNKKQNYFTREKIDLTSGEDWYKNLLEPMSLSDIKKTVEQDGTMGLLTRWLPSVEGIQVQDKRSFVDDLPTLIKRNADSDTQDKAKITNNNEGGRQVTNEEFSEYNKQRNELITSAITKMYNEGYPVKRENKVDIIPYKDMTKDEIYKATSEIKKKSTSLIKETLFGEKEDTDEEKEADKELKQLKQIYFSNE